MAIAFPYDVLEGFPGWSTDFQLLWRQEQSRTAGGQTLVKDLGSPLWSTTYLTRTLRPNELDAWRARLDVLENGLNQFVGRPLSRCYPIAYPRPVFDSLFPAFGAAAINSINANRKAISLKNLPANYKLSVGDMITIGSGTTFNLHRVMEAATANGSGVTPQFEIRPHLWPLTAENNLAAIHNPFCLMTIVPGSISSTADLSTGRGVISFQAVESR
ncbi:hypothetical protein QFZ34_002053 [Phyllobacterium ifriqiyense]|uniref:Uncharacterized protein n=1 Tax=Phyllobacterium ifriqiyense TaxID=314238 RepID=A0ABU0S7Z6_9HYPH|nr:hypothetical protein [Phyllobacterium ifriqiyense]MDQ0996871.1 hypothetical protein [Phyllobacterium ifriqiyense]